MSDKSIDQESQELPAEFNPFQSNIIEANIKLKSPENPDELNSRLNQDEMILQHRLWLGKRNFYFNALKELVLTIAFCVALGISLSASWEILTNPKSSVDAQKGAAAAFSSVITLAISGIGGYIMGKRSSDESKNSAGYKET